MRVTGNQNRWPGEVVESLAFLLGDMIPRGAFKLQPLCDSVISTKHPVSTCLERKRSSC